MLSDAELARRVFPKAADVVADGTNNAPLVTTAHGHAVADSASGTVTVVLDADAAGVDASIDVPTGARIAEGDEVLVTISGTTPVDAVAAGWGDTLGDKVDSVTNYFWHDTQGAHVATVEGDATTGQNVLIDSNSLDIRSGSDVLASFDADGLHLYDEQGNEFAYFTGSVVLLGGGTAQILMPYSLIESTADQFNHWVNWATTQGWKVESHSYESGSGNFAYIYANSEEHRWTLDENDGCTVYIEAANAAVQADGIPAAHVGVYTWLDDGTPANHASNVEITGGSINIAGESSTYNKTMDGFIADLQGGGAADYVVDEGGTSADHRYRKWASGRLEQWVRHYTTTTINTTWGNLYRTSSSYTGETWPVEFDQIYHCYTTVTADGGDMAFVGSASAATTTRADNYYLLRGAALTTAKGFMISSYGVGTWSGSGVMNNADETSY